MTTSTLPAHILADIKSVHSIDAVPRILDAICKTTGMGFAAVARVTEDRWVACSVQDNVNFGLVPGGELEVQTTICDEIRQSRKLVVIDHVNDDDVFYGHHTPIMYGFQSYISVPIILKDGSFFGTLCAIDLKPQLLSTNGAVQMFQLFAELLVLHLDSIKYLEKAA